MKLRHILATTCLAAALAFGQAGGGPNPEQRLQKLATELNLSDDQKKRLADMKSEMRQGHHGHR